MDARSRAAGGAPAHLRPTGTPDAARRARLHVETAEDGRRLDRFLAARMPDVSRARIHRLIVEERVLLDGRPRKPSAKVHAGQTVEIQIPPPVPSHLLPEAIPLTVLYEDGELLVVNKPAGMAVHPGAGRPNGTLANALLAHVPDLAGVGGVLRPGIVHRLDKDTSGVLVVAKNDAALRSLQEQIKSRTARRVYRAIVHGRVEHQEGTIDAPIGRDPRHRRRMAVVQAGRPAVTRYRVLERFPDATLVEASLLTGRTHQIRVHFAHIGHPVVGDSTYGRVTETWGMERQALHAHRLVLAHPRTGEPLTVEAPLPTDMIEAMERLRAERPEGRVGRVGRRARRDRHA